MHIVDKYITMIYNLKSNTNANKIFGQYLWQGHQLEKDEISEAKIQTMTLERENYCNIFYGKYQIVLWKFYITAKTFSELKTIVFISSLLS